MSFLEKIGLIQYDVPEAVSVPDPIDDVVAPDVNVDDVKSDTVIEDIYSQNGLNDLSKSIYKAHEFMSALPKEMPENAKRGSVMSILQTASLEVDNLVADANDRIQILVSAKESIIKNQDEIIDSAKADIEKLNQAITDLNNSIYSANVEKEQSSKKIDEEIKFLNDTVSFLKGDK